MKKWVDYDWDGVPIKVSSLGEIVVKLHVITRRNGKAYTVRPRLAKQFDHPMGYKTCQISKGSMTLVHRVVCSAFHENPLSLTCVNHKNGVKDDNREENLEWVSYAENNRHMREVLGRKAFRSKFTEDQIKRIREDERRYTDIANDYGTSSSYIGSIKMGKTWKGIGGNLSAPKLGEGSRPLTSEQIEEIKSSDIAKNKLAEKYKVSCATISRVKHGRRKKNVS